MLRIRHGVRFKLINWHRKYLKHVQGIRILTEIPIYTQICVHTNENLKIIYTKLLNISCKQANFVIACWRLACVIARIPFKYLVVAKFL